MTFKRLLSGKIPSLPVRNAEKLFVRERVLRELISLTSISFAALANLGVVHQIHIRFLYLEAVSFITQFTF